MWSIDIILSLLGAVDFVVVVAVVVNVVVVFIVNVVVVALLFIGHIIFSCG